MKTVTIRRLARDEWRTYRDLRLLALADSPDAFSRTLAEEQRRVDADWAGRLASASELDLPLVADVDGEPIGLAWGRIDASSPLVAHLYQMWVAPRCRRLGAGRLLLGAVIRWAEAANVHSLVLGVTCGDTPAMRLYLRAGFRPAGEPEPLRAGSAALAQTMRLDLDVRQA